MAIALNSTLRSFRYRLVNGAAGQFFNWWVGELRNLMPTRLRVRLQYARRRLLMQVADGQVLLSIENADEVLSLDALSTEQDVQLQQQHVRELLVQHELTEVNRDLLLSASCVLSTQVAMPLAAEANLRQALAYEMDRHTPFEAGEVFYSWRILSRDREAGQLNFELYVTPREPVEENIELLKRLGLAPTGVDVLVDTKPRERSLGLNLLPQALRFHIINQRTRLNGITAAVTVFLLIFVMTQSLWLREHQVVTLGKAIDSVRSEAMAVQQIRKQIDDASEAAGFLQSRKIENGYKVELLAELTRVLPTNTYLDRLSVHTDSIQMQGKSANAQSLIELINDSPYFENASFRGPTRLDTRSRKEIFDLNANNVLQDVQ